jgi:hypothetical protein
MVIPMSDNLTIIFGIVSLISLFVGFYQTFNMEKSKKAYNALKKANEALNKAYEEKCVARCIDLAEITGVLAENMVTVCEIVRTRCISRNKLCNILMAKTEASVGITKQLISFCIKLNKEHFDEFGHYADADLSQKLQAKWCLDPIMESNPINRN